MRGIHRPIHQNFIFAKDWVTMSDSEKEKASKEGKFKLELKKNTVKLLNLMRTKSKSN